jgi:hypothetical protein
MGITTPVSSSSAPIAWVLDNDVEHQGQQIWEGIPAEISQPNWAKFFLSILSIKYGKRFYWADRAETAERAENKESFVYMLI